MLEQHSDIVRKRKKKLGLKMNVYMLYDYVSGVRFLESGVRRSIFTWQPPGNPTMRHAANLAANGPYATRVFPHQSGCVHAAIGP